MVAKTRMDMIHTVFMTETTNNNKNTILNATTGKKFITKRSSYYVVTHIINDILIHDY